MLLRRRVLEMAYQVDFLSAGTWASQTIAAESFTAEAVWVTFYSADAEQVAAVPTVAVLSVVKVDD